MMFRTSPLLLVPFAWLSTCLSAAESGVLLRESFAAGLSDTRVDGVGRPGVAYKGDHLWTTASEGPPGKSETSFRVVQGRLLADSVGSREGNDSAIFRTADWNPEGAEALDISFDITLDPGDQKNRYWGAVILSAHAWRLDMPEVGAGPEDQHLHLRFHTEGHLGLRDASFLKKDVLDIGPDRRNTVRIRFNGSPAPLDGLKPGHSHIWVNGERVAENVDLRSKALDAAGPVALNYLELRSFGSLNSDNGAPIQAWFDNISVTAVPR